MDVLKKYWPVVAVLAAMAMLTASDGVLDASPKSDVKDQAYAAGVCSWCLACEASPATPVVNPSPSGGICDNCNGRGRVGDGTVMVTCPECDGTGRIGPTRPDDGAIGDGAYGFGPSPASEAASFPPPDQEDDPVADLDCSDGSCSTSGGTVRTRRRIFGGFFRRR